MDHRRTTRQHRIAVIRQQIEDGTYESAAKLDAALEAFLDDARQQRLTPGRDRSDASRRRPR